MSKQCEGAQRQVRLEEIYEYLDGELSMEDVRVVKAHLDACPECTYEADVEQVIRQILKRSCHDAAPVSLRERILTRIDALRVERSAG